MNNCTDSICQVQEQDLSYLKKFLLENNLRASIKINSSSLFYYAKNGEQIIGSIGAEFNQKYALLRAAGIAKEWRRKGIARKLFSKLTDELQKRGITELYLFSRQAAEFWTKMGFRQCNIQEVIQVLSETPQVKEFLSDNTIWTDIAWHKTTKPQ